MVDTKNFVVDWISSYTMNSIWPSDYATRIRRIKCFKHSFHANACWKWKVLTENKSCYSKSIKANSTSLLVIYLQNQIKTFHDKHFSTIKPVSKPALYTCNETKFLIFKQGDHVKPINGSSLNRSFSYHVRLSPLETVVIQFRAHKRQSLKYTSEKR